MKFSFGSAHLHEREIAERECYLLTNRLGGYSSTTVINSLTRNDHALFIAAIKAPDIRFRLVSKIDERITISGKQYNLSSQSYVDYTKNTNGQVYLINFTKQYLPVWRYFIDGVTVVKTVVMVDSENTVAVKYEIDNPLNLQVSLSLTPIYSFVSRTETLDKSQKFEIKRDSVFSNGVLMNIYTNCDDFLSLNSPEFIDDYYFAYDARDGRSSYGVGAMQTEYIYNTDKSREVSIAFSTEKGAVSDANAIIENEIKRQREIVLKSGLKSPLGKTLALAADSYIAKRESIDGLTLIAGYPFFTDWGRDTMYTIEGCCIATGRFDETKDILRTFVRHLKNGLMPNLFPEGDNPPIYNTVDASLLFINTVYLYYKKSGDREFVCEVFPAIKEIINCYKNGTDFDIKMDTDALISAGSGLMQLTWMDVRYQDILPTPRHGKPVEINAYWYNALKIASFFAELLQEKTENYEQIAELAKKSFVEKFWCDEIGCLLDVLSGGDCDRQIRCNQIWAVSVPFSPLPNDLATSVVDTVYRKLYTPYGLRSLAPDDKSFVPEYSGNLKKRDLSYHQGTVWTFPLGSFFRSYLKVNNYDKASVSAVKEKLELFSDCLHEGCIGQIAEIYDGLHPTFSRGCFAQGWSVCEILKIIAEIEEIESLYD